jgi:hypothetical protein
MLPGLISQHGVHGRRIDDLIRVKYAMRIPGTFYLLQQPVILFAYHLPDKLSAQSSVTMFSAERSTVFFYKCCNFFGNLPE